jgi:hypothetical protein
LRKIKFVIICFFLLSFSLTAYGSNMKTTEEENFVHSFIAELYTFDNNSLKNLSFYKFSYPMDKYTLNLRDYMLEKTFDDFTKKDLYYNFIISSYSYGFDSSVYFIKLNPSERSLDDITYKYTATVELFFNHKSKREIYEVNGELIVTKINNEYKITKISNIKFPSTGSSNVISNLV